MFGSGSRANGLSEGRVGTTRIFRPSSGIQTTFGKMRAGDFFSYEGRLYFKINLVDGVEVPDGKDCVIGTQQFSDACSVQAENVHIKIL